MRHSGGMSVWSATRTLARNGVRGNISFHHPATGGLRQGSWIIRPVSLRVDGAGLLTFSDDASGTVNKIGYKP